MSSKEERQMAGRAVFAKMFLDDAKPVVGAIRDWLEEHVGPDESVAAELPDGTRIGTFKRSKPPRQAKNVNAEATLVWVREHRPDQLVIAESVAKAFVDYLLDRVREFGDAVLPDGTIVPGFEMAEGKPSYLPQPDEAKAPLVAARAGALIGSGMLALPAAEEKAAS